MVDAAFPHHRLRQALLGKFVREAARRDHDMLRGAVEPADEAPDEVGRHRQPRRDIFGEARVIGGREGKMILQAPAPRREAQRSFGRDVDRLRGEGTDAPADRAPSCEGQADFAIGRAGDRAEQVWRDHAHLMPLGAKFADRRLQCPDDAVDLRRPGVGDDQDSHAARLRPPWPVRAATVARGCCAPRLPAPSAGFPCVRRGARPTRCIPRPSRRRYSS